MNTIPMIRYLWNDRQYHLDNSLKMDTTFLICQRETPELIRLCLESLLRYYPDIPIVVVDGDSKDESIMYLKWKQLTNPNIKVVNMPKDEGSKFTSHGLSMDYAIREHITTKYVFLLDSDAIVERGVFLELMLGQFNSRLFGGPVENQYAIGTLMNVSYSNDACGDPKDENDSLKYAHPSASLIDRDIYLELPPATDHGSPLCYNMKCAQDKGYAVEYFPIDKYIFHLGGASWQERCTIPYHDHDVFIRPFVTFIISDGINNFACEKDNDFELLPLGDKVVKEVGMYDEPDYKLSVNNYVYSLRFKVHGEYVCEVPPTHVMRPGFMEEIKKSIIEHPLVGDTVMLSIMGLYFYKRNYWQRNNALR
jgi:glycosyltransferase involved in cell wall biosynthesis